MRHLFFLYALLLLPFGLAAQDFSYTVSSDSVAWNELNAQTILNTSNSAWEFAYRIPIGFSFNYLGRSFDSLTIETNGYLVFDAEHSYSFTAFNQFGDHIDGQGNHAVIGYELSGGTNNHVLKIQYKDAAQWTNDSRVQSWQIWLGESGAITVVAGPGTYRHAMLPMTVPDSSVTSDSLQGTQVSYFESTRMVYQTDSSQYCRIGLLNQNMDTETSGYLIGGSTLLPTGMPIGNNNNNDSHAYLITIPEQGYRYVFTPAHN